MPLIDIHVLEGVFTDEEKARIISGTAKAFGAVAGETMQLCWVVPLRRGM